MRYQPFQVLCGLLFACAAFWPAASLASLYNTVDDATFRQLIEEFKADPTIIARDRDLSKKLTTEQIDTLTRELGLEPFTWVYAQTVKGREAPDLLQHDTDDISVMAVRAGKLVPIPFQIDERDQAGWVYVEGISEEQIEGTAGKLDENDDIVFMYRDTGQERYDAASMNLASGTISKELTLEFNGKKRYAYLVTGSDQRSNAVYTEFDEETLTFVGNFHSFRSSPDNMLIFENYQANAGPTPEHRVLDTVFLDLSTGVITRWPRVSVGLQNIEARLMGVKHGPVREVLLLSIRVVVAGIPVFFIRSDMTLYDEGIVLPVKLSIPGGEILTRILNRPIIDIGLDMNELTGGRFSTAVNPIGRYGTIDGKIDEVEEQLAIEVPNENWLWLESGRGFDVMMQIRIPPDWPVEAELYYEDDPEPEKSFEVEDFPGAYPRMGVRVTELPVGKLNIDLSVILWFPATVGDEGPVPFAAGMDTPPSVTVHDI